MISVSTLHSTDLIDSVWTYDICNRWQEVVMVVIKEL